jgi:glycosyltransferase involved in cell wall biosynthesis
LRFRFEGDNRLDVIVSSVIDDEERLSEMGRRSRSRVEERYQWSDVADRYEEVLEGLC